MSSSPELAYTKGGAPGAYVAKVKTKLTSVHWTRLPGHTPMMWNGIQGDFYAADSSSDGSELRRLGLTGNDTGSSNDSDVDMTK